MLSDDLFNRAFGHAFDGVALGMCVVDVELNYIQINDSWCSMLGYPPGGLVGRSVLAVSHPEDRDDDQELSERLFRGEIPYFRVRKRWIRADGSILRGTLTASVLHEPERPPWGIGVVYPEGLNLLSRPVASALEESTGDRLAGLLADDLSTALQAAGEQAERLAGEFGTSARLDQVRQALERAHAVTRGLVSLSSAREMPPHPIRVSYVLAKAARSARPLVPAEVRIVEEPVDDACRVVASVAGLEQLVVNLILNARDATVGTGVIRLSARRLGESVEICVDDQGRGIPPATQSEVFKPFFTTKRERRGAGLGLALVRSIAAEASGTIDLDSRPGEGTRVRVTLPVAPVA